MITAAATPNARAPINKSTSNHVASERVTTAEEQREAAMQHAAILFRVKLPMDPQYRQDTMMNWRCHARYLF